MPPAPTSRGRLCCRGGLTAPILLPPLARPSLHSPTPPVILRRRQPHTAAKPVNPHTPLRVGIHYRVVPGSVYSPAPRRPLPRPCRRPPPWCSWRGVINDVHPMAIVLLQPLVFLLQPPKVAPVVPPAPASRGRLCYHGGLTAPILLPPLARPSLHSPTPRVILQRRQPHTIAEPVNPHARLRVGIHCRVFPGSVSSPS